MAAAVVAVVAASLWGVRLLGGQAVPAASPHPAGRVAALACPARYAKQAPWVPAKPAGVDGRSRLVPQQVPRSALICAYAGRNNAKQLAGWALSGRRSLTGSEDRAMVPAGSVSLTVCTPRAHTFTSGFQALIRALNRLPTQPSTGRCSPSPASSTPTWYDLYFSYSQGPPVLVEIAVGCYPEVGNLYLDSHSASSVMPIIRQLLKAK